MFDWNDYFALAKKLKRQTILVEACLRSSISRAYYAAYNIAFKYSLSGNLRPVFGPTGSGEDHKYLSDYYKSIGRTRGNDDLLEVGNLLRGLYRRREKCDYNDTIKGNITDLTRRSILDAQKIINITTV